MNHNLFSLIVHIFSDPIPGDVGFVYLFGQTEDNQFSVLEKGVELQQKGYSIMVSGNKEGSGYPGYAAWSGYFRKKGATPPFPIIQERYAPANTLTEAENLVRHLAETGIEKVGIVAAPFHQLRAFFTTVGVILKNQEKIFTEHRLEIKAYSMPGAPLLWNEEVIHSQGITRGRRRDLLISEWEKTNSYIQKGDIPSSTRVFEYLEWRESVEAVR